MTKTKLINKWSFSLLLTSLACGVIFDYLFFDKTPGISIPLFLLMSYGIFFSLFPHTLRIEKSFAWFLTLTILLLSLTFVFFSSDEFAVLNGLFLVILIPIHLILLTKTNQNKWYQLIFLWEVIIKVIRSMIYIVVPFRLITAWMRQKPKNKSPNVLGKILIGLIIASPLVLFILSLLASADLIFQTWLDSIPNLLDNMNLENIPEHLFLIGFIFFAVFAYGWMLHLPPQKKLPKSSKERFRIDGIVMLTIFTLVNLVYVFFTAIQVSYLFGTAKKLLPNGVTYADYATQGFYQLVTVSMLNLLLVIIGIYRVQKNKIGLFRAMQVLLSLLTVCTMLILVSAFQKLTLYESVYGYTYTRVLVSAFMILLAILLVVIMIKIWKNQLSLMKFYLVLILIWYVVLNYVNIDQLIVKQNIAHYYKEKQSGQLIKTAKGDRYYNEYVDVYYLTKLSYDAIPQLITLYKKEPALRSYLTWGLSKKRDELMKENTWESFNLSKHKAKKLLKQLPLKQQIENTPHTVR